VGVEITPAKLHLTLVSTIPARALKEFYIRLRYVKTDFNKYFRMKLRFFKKLVIAFKTILQVTAKVIKTKWTKNGLKIFSKEDVNVNCNCDDNDRLPSLVFFKPTIFFTSSSTCKRHKTSAFTTTVILVSKRICCNSKIFIIFDKSKNA
jgi:hypothetical protein